MDAPKNIPRSPITEALVHPFKLLLDEFQDIQPMARLRLIKAYEASVSQQILLNDKLQAIMSRLDLSEEDPTDTSSIIQLSSNPPLPDAQIAQVGASAGASHGDHRHPGGVIGPAGYVAGVLTFGGAVEQTGTEFTFVAAYLLPIVGPDISISGTDFLPITHSVIIPNEHESIKLLTWSWSATNSGVDALWRLRNQTTSETLLLGSRAAPFSDTLELIEDQVLEAAMPSVGDMVALEVCFSAAGSGGEIQLEGPATWEVS